MKLALLADIHANLQALQACLADARTRGATQYAFLGDLVGYGADPSPVLDIVMARVAQGAPAVKGNHDEAAVAPVAGSTRADHIGGVWTHAQLTRAQLDFLDGLPLTVRDGHALLVHACVREPQRWTYITRPLEAADSMDAAHSLGASLVFTGHVHEQRLFYQGAVGKLMAFQPTPGVAVPVGAHREWLATVGSVGQPRDGDPRACFGILDDQAKTLSYERVEYDIERTALRIVEAGLSEHFARRLFAGI